MVDGGAPPVELARKGDHSVLAGGALSPDGQVVAAILGARSAGAASPGRVAVVRLDSAGRPLWARDYPLVASQSPSMDSAGWWFYGTRTVQRGEP